MAMNPTQSEQMRHKMLHYPFQVEHGLAWIVLPREGITLADAERMAELVKTVVTEPEHD